jgi:AcrR family transcriptional regulator
VANDRIDRTIRERRRGTRKNEAGRETRERILDEAERLFAIHGLDAVSVREITDSADVNTAAIHYHFGSKHDLIAAILARRAGPFSDRRLELLGELERAGDPDLRAVVRALVLPNYELATDGKGGANYIAFLAALGNHAELMPLIAEYFDEGIERSMAMLAKVTPHLPMQVRELRMAIAKDLVNRLLGQPNGQVRVWSEARSPGSTDDMLTVLTDVIVGIFQADVTPTRRPRRRKAVAAS